MKTWGKTSNTQCRDKHKADYASWEGVMERDCGSVGRAESQQGVPMHHIFWNPAKLSERYTFKVPTIKM